MLASGGRVAFVADKKPDRFMGYPVVNGDETDLRFLEGNTAIWLSPKGHAKTIENGFVQKEAI